MKVNKFLVTLLIILATGSLLVSVVKGSGVEGKINHQSPETRDSRIGSPFESSGSTSRYALAEAMVEDRTMFLNLERAKFASPDVAKFNDRYFSLFQPGVSWWGAPFYWLGRIWGLPQLFTFGSTTLVAIINSGLIAYLARRIGVGYYTAWLCGLVWLWGTNALVYAMTFTQHHLSTWLILLAVISAIGKRTWLNNVWFGLIFGAGLLVDLPNGLMMLPLVIYVLYQQLEVVRVDEQVKVNLKINFVGLLIGLLPMIGLLGWYNYQLIGSYTSMAQFIGRTADFSDQQPATVESGESESHLKSWVPFNLRNQIHGLYVLLISDQSSLLVYSPIVLLGLVGLYFAYQQAMVKKKILVLVISSVFFANLLIYSLFGDPSGGWAFGPRYLIPGAAILAIFTGIVIDRYRYRLWFTPVFCFFCAYSIAVNVLGVMTTTQVPPRVEAVALPDPIPYTYEYNWQLITDKGLNSSLVYNLSLVPYLSSAGYTAIYVIVVYGLVMMVFLITVVDRKKLSTNQNLESKPLSMRNMLFAKLMAPWLSSIVGKPRADFPERMGEFKYKERMDTDSINGYEFAIYENPSGRKAVAKKWQGKVKDMGYYSLKNEQLLLNILFQVRARVQNSLPKRYVNLHIPQMVGDWQTNNCLIVFKQYVQGKKATAFNKDKRIDVYIQAIEYVKFLGECFNGDEKNLMVERKPLGIVILYPLLLVKALVTNYKFSGDLIRGIPVFLKSAPLFIRSKSLVFGDRDLNPENIIVAGKDIYLIDLQFGMFSEPLYDTVYRMCVQWYETDMRDKLLNHLNGMVKSYGVEFDVLIRGLIAHVGTHALTVSNLPQLKVESSKEFLELATRANVKINKADTELLVG